MPSSRAISAIGRPLVRTSSTASRLNSAVNWRRSPGCLSSMQTSSRSREVSCLRGEVQARSFHILTQLEAQNTSEKAGTGRARVSA